MSSNQYFSTFALTRMTCRGSFCKTMLRANLQFVSSRGETKVCHCYFTGNHAAHHMSKTTAPRQKQGAYLQSQPLGRRQGGAHCTFKTSISNTARAHLDKTITNRKRILSQYLQGFRADCLHCVTVHQEAFNNNQVIASRLTELACEGHVRASSPGPSQ